MTKYFFLIITLSFSLFAQENEEFLPVDYPAHYSAALNTVYVTVGAWEGKMDIYRLSNSQQPTPVVINIHGGGWARGVKESQRGFGSFFKNGWTVANMGYRLSTVAPAPAAIQDVRCAVIYLIKNAKQLNIDPNKIVLMGGSAGGHLALMAGLLSSDKKFDGNCSGIDSVKIAAIIDKYGVTDLFSSKDVRKSKSARAWLGEKIDDQEFLRSVSPLTYISKNSPPIFIVHGDADPTVPYWQSVDLHKKLVEAGVKTDFLTVPGGAHGKFPQEKNTEISEAMWKFLNRTVTPE